MSLKMMMTMMMMNDIYLNERFGVAANSTEDGSRAAA